MLSFLNRGLCAVRLMACSFMVQAGELTVSPAASLTDAFKEIGRAFEAQNPGTDVRFNFGASDALVQQLAAGAPVDVLATADQESMDKAVAQKLIEPSIRGWVSACLKRGGLEYADVEDVKDSGAYVRDVRKYIANASLKEPPEASRIAKLYFSQRDGAIAELGGEPRMLFALFAIAAESVYQEKPELFGGIDDIDAHKEKVAQLAGRREELHKRIPTSWDNSDVVIGRITSDFAALISWKMAPECPVGNRDVAERLIDYLLEREEPRDAQAA